MQGARQQPLPGARRPRRALFYPKAGALSRLRGGWMVDGGWWLAAGRADAAHPRLPTGV